MNDDGSDNDVSLALHPRYYGLGSLAQPLFLQRPAYGTQLHDLISNRYFQACAAKAEHAR